MQDERRFLERLTRLYRVAIRLIDSSVEESARQSLYLDQGTIQLVRVVALLERAGNLLLERYADLEEKQRADLEEKSG